MTAWYANPITHGYISSYDPSVWDTPHYAVDIAMPLHTPVTALKSGTVVQADYAPWGGEVFIQPDDRSTEYYYYHFDENEVATGQHVNQGQEVGLSGGQNQGGVHPVPSEWSSGPHTHIGYFTNWTSTPIGTRPYGPDITPLINQAKIGGLGSGGESTLSQLSSGGPDLSQLGINIGIFVVAIILIIFGSIFLFQKQIMEGMHHVL